MNLSLSTNTYINKTIFTCTKPFNYSFKGNTTTSEDTFVHTTSTMANPFETGKRKFEISDYKALSKDEIDTIKKRFCRKKVIEIAQRDIHLAIKLKEHLDKEYGENNYIFECIGTSPTTIARVFEFMGIETHYLPFSDVRLSQKKFPHWIIKKNKEGQKAYAEFLKSQGIDKKQIKNSDKTYIFYDYTCTGKTLKEFEKILKKCFKIPVKNINVEFKSINDDFSAVFNIPKAEYGYIMTSKCDQETIHCINYINDELSACDASKYGGLEHLSFEELQNITEIEKKQSDYNAKIYNFLVMDELNKLGLLKENSANKNSL